VNTQNMGSVLLVSPNEQTLNAVGSLLHQHDIKVVRASSDVETIFCLRRSILFDAAIVDLSVKGQEWAPVVDMISSALREKPVIVFVPQADIKTAVTAIKSGAYDYLLEPIDLDEIIVSLRRALSAKVQYNVLRAKQNQWSRESDVIIMSSQSPLMKEALQRLGILSRTEASLVIKGPRGVGKESWARTAHFLSSRRFQPFIKVECPNKTADELLVEIFGSIKESKCENRLRGLSVLSSANGGTIFFDDITALPMRVQYKLIDFIEETERLISYGGGTNLPNVRFMTSIETNAKTFLENNEILRSFWEKICGGIVEVPALANRAEDIPMIVDAFVSIFSQRLKKDLKGVPEEVVEVLQTYHWPGNDRELYHIIEHAAALAKDGKISLNDLPLPKEQLAKSMYFQLQLRSFELDHVEEELINQVLRFTGGNMSRTASTLGISRGTLYNKLKKYGIEEKSKRSSQEI